MQGKKRTTTKGGKYDRLKKPAHQLESLNVCVEQIVRAIVALELWVPDFSKPQRTLWDELERDMDAPVDFVKVADVLDAAGGPVIRLHPRQVSFCALHGVRAREVVAYLCHMREQVPDEPERDALTVLKHPSKSGQYTAHASIAAVYAAVRAVLGLDKELQHGTH